MIFFRNFAFLIVQVKDSELRELEQHSKKLEVMIEKLKTDIELLETTSRVGIEKLRLDPILLVNSLRFIMETLNFRSRSPSCRSSFVRRTRKSISPRRA